MKRCVKGAILNAITARVVQPQEAPDAIQLSLLAGDVVQVQHAHPDLTGYAWAEDGQRSAGRGPLDVLGLYGGCSRAKAEYWSAELTVSPNDVVRLM